MKVLAKSKKDYIIEISKEDLKIIIDKSDFTVGEEIQISEKLTVLAQLARRQNVFVRTQTVLVALPLAVLRFPLSFPFFPLYLYLT